MRPIGTNGKEMSDRAWRNLNDFIARMNVQIAAKKARKESA